MRVNRPAAQQAEMRVNVEVGRLRRIKRRDPGDFGRVLRDMGLHVRTGRLAPKRGGRLELRGRRRGGESRRDRVREPIAMMPARDQCLALVVAARRGVEQVGGRMAVHQHLARDHPHAAPLRILEQRIDRRGMDRAENGRRRDAVAQILVEIARGNRSRVVDVGVARFRRKRARGEPFQQRLAAGADDRQLRIVHVRVDEAAADQRITVVRDRRIRRKARRDLVSRAAIDDAAVRHRDDRIALVAPHGARVGGERIAGKGKECAANGAGWFPHA